MKANVNPIGMAQETPLDDTQLEATLPKPKGYKVLIALPEVKQTFSDSKIIKADSTQREEKILSMVAVVIDIGDDAYADSERFPNGPWCKVGDFVMFRPNSGTRFTIQGQEFRLINDDSVEATVEDPRNIARA